MNDTNRKRRNDIILLAGLLIIGAILFAVISFTGEPGGKAEVLVDGKVVTSYSLSIDQKAALEHNGYNLLVIKDGVASVDEADCPDKLCVEQRKISKNGETIVCLPHKTVIRISGSEEKEFDGVVE